MTTPSPPPWRELFWCSIGTVRAEIALASLGDDEFAAPCALPGWTRAHLVTHLARNAEALVNLCTWARTGVETPMYTDNDQRRRDIEEGSTRSPAEIRLDFASQVRVLDDALASLEGPAWDTTVRTAQGRLVPAQVVPWLRARELFVHGVDLEAPVHFGFSSFPPKFLDALIAEITATYAQREGVERFAVQASDRPHRDPEHAGEVVVRGPAAELAAWLSGRPHQGLRSSAGGGTLPELGPWL